MSPFAVATTFRGLPAAAAGALASPLGLSHEHPVGLHQLSITSPLPMRKYVIGVCPLITVTNGLPGAAGKLPPAAVTSCHVSEKPWLVSSEITCPLGVRK